jgi:hypothetical protein
VRAGDEPNPDWRHVKELHAGSFLVRFEDSNPYRDCRQLPVTAWVAFGRWTANHGVLQIGRSSDYYYTE